MKSNSIEARPPLIQLDKFVGQGGDDFATRQVALAYCEEGNVSLNISKYGIFRRDGIIYDEQSGLELELDPEKEFGKEEIEGMENIFKLADEGLNTIFWISPSGGSYVSARLVVARAEKINDGMTLKCRGIVVNKTPWELMQIATRMVCFEGGIMRFWINNAEGLRSQPIGVNLKEEDWIDFGKKMFGMSEVWEAIRQGKDIELRDTMEFHVRQARSEVSGMGLSGRRLDAAFEYAMLARGYKLNENANHGGSALSSDKQMGVFDRIFSNNGLIKIDGEGNVWHCCKQCGQWYMGDKCSCVV